AYNVNYMMQWMEPTFTRQAECAIDQFIHAFNQSRDEHFPPDSLTAVSSNNKETVQAGSSIQKKFGNNYPRLVEVKNKYDPSGLFG
ncbi:hypothetical protein FRC07_004576, partial [Ceratobasidium sp. 392]